MPFPLSAIALIAFFLEIASFNKFLSQSATCDWSCVVKVFFDWSFLFRRFSLSMRLPGEVRCVDIKKFQFLFDVSIVPASALKVEFS